ncbi:hypothetical protein [Cohaesibacter haloalkalitolerans]|uniref:hypothetical protein n=1 Tax=Cohaesibacter haloalkalitolerans TaxID=1162980 RepID=UPI000E64F041|nr:hypothetical protein [Cohaesibacter haloalkalitolerans]
MTAVAQRQKLTLTTERNPDEGHSLNSANAETAILGHQVFSTIENKSINQSVARHAPYRLIQSIVMIRNDSAFHIQPDESETE